MAEAVAQTKYECPGCGADAHWNPSKTALVCPYCGTNSPTELNADTGVVVENDLVSALRNLSPEQRGWKAEKVSVRCQSCQAVSVFSPERTAQRCEFCGSAQIVPLEQVLAPIRPECLLPFTVSEPQVREAMRSWYGSRWFAPNRLKTAALTDTLKGIYLPYWTFDARAISDWTAEAGYHYYETETYRDSNGQTQTRQVQRTRWQWASGRVDHFFDDELVSASRGVDSELLRKIEPFPTKHAAPYDAGYVAGWTVEQYQIDLISAAQRSRDRMGTAMHSRCASDVPGDTHRNLSVSTAFHEQTFKHMLLPVWLLSYTYGSKNFQVLVNGSTGQIAGHRPWSIAKLFFFTLGCLILVLILIGLFNR